MNIPKLRFKDNNGNDYPQWNYSSFYNTFNFLSTNNYSRNDMNSINGNIRNIHYGDILTKFNYIINTEKDILPYLNDNIIIKNLPNYIIQSGDIVIADTAEDYTTGKTCEIINSNNQLVVAGLHTMLCRPKQNIFALGFLGYFMNSNIYHNQLLPLITGIKVYSIIKKEIIKTKISIPFIEEQKKIAKFLTTVDKKIENLKNTITSLENQKKGLLQQIFSQKLRFKDENGNNYPNWKEKLFSEIFSFLSTNSYSRAEMNEYQGTVKNIHYGDVLIKFNHIIDLSKHQLPYLINYNSIPKKILKEQLNKQLIKNGDIIIADTAEDYTAGKVCEVINVNDNLIVSGLHTMLCRPKPNLFSLGFLGYFMNSYTYHHQLLKLITGTKVYSIIKKEIIKTKILIPCLEEQTKIADFLSAFDRKLENKKAQLEHWRQIKKGLLQQMFV